MSDHISPTGAWPAAGPRVSPVMEEREDASDAAEAADEQTEARQEEDHGDEEGEVRGLRDPAQPTREERARHELTNLPFRTWCRHCVAGKAADDPHERG